MPHDPVSRRQFLQNVAAGSAGAALAGAPAAAATPPSGGAEPPVPSTVESYPIASPGKGLVVDRLKIVSTESLNDPYAERVRNLSSGLELKMGLSDDAFHGELADAHVIFGDFSRRDFAAAKQVRWIQWGAAGVEGILWPELVESPVVLTNMQRIYAPVISETAIALMLALARGIPRYSMQTAQHQWKTLDGLNEISGMTLGLVGLGGIGTETARRAHFGFGMTVLAVDPKPIPKPDFVAELHSLDWLTEMASRADILMSATPHTPLSEGMLNESVFRSMKKSAYFVNVSRGKVVNTPDLVRALKEGRIAGAGLDVAYKEPLPADDELWTCPNVIITCHTSGWSPKVQARRHELFAENVRRYVSGLPLLNVVDKQRGY
ncbi:MAG TPA: D-2-hydroxyacid dehydrogenase [Terriglobia bacterium]|nr:D-2-hydroxyacid dehydrogenase [Terriglobia bacterium]